MSVTSARAHPALAAAMVSVPALGVAAAAVLAWRDGGVSVVSLGLFAVFYVVSMIGVEAGMHRYFSHRSFKCGRALRLALGIAGSTAGQGPVLFWASTHRRHHLYSDTANDPHAPRGQGAGAFWHAHIGWLFEPQAADAGRDAPDLARDAASMLAHRWYFAWLLAGLALPAAMGGIFGGAHGALTGFLWGGLVRVFVVHHLTWSVNSLCHLVGSRPYGSRDASRNIGMLALPTMGGAWHNNHHAYPAVASTAHRWWQIDPSGLFIGAMETLGLAWDVRRLPPKKMRESRMIKLEAP